MRGQGVLVTGAARRIGQAIATGLAADGWAVAVHYGRSGDAAAALVATIEEAGGRAAALGCDLADVAAVETLIARAGAAVGALGALVNCASRFVYDDAAGFSAAEFDAHMAVNARAPALLTRDFAAALGASTQGAENQGTVINVLDQKVFNLNPDFLSYTLSKVTLEALTRLMAMALAPAVRVCGVAPGITLPSASQSARGFAAAHGAAPMGRGAQPADILAAVRYLLDAPSVTGDTLIVDGGQHLERRARDIMFDATDRDDRGAKPS